MIDASHRFIETEIEIAVPPERVWHAWTDPDEFVTWWGEDGLYRVERWTGDVRVGGRWRSEGTLHDGKSFYVEGKYLRVDPPTYLSFTWRHDWDDVVRETVVSLEFLRTPSGTRLKLMHSGFATDQSRDSHNQGWGKVLGWLHAHLEMENS